MYQGKFSVLKCVAALCILLGATGPSRAGEPHQKGYSDSKGATCDCYGCRPHFHMKHPPRAPVASAVAAPQFVVAQSNVVNPLSANASSINPNLLRALASLMDQKDDSSASAAESANSPSQKGSSNNSAASSQQASGKRDLETEVTRLKDLVGQLIAEMEKLEKSTTRELQSLSNDS